MKTTPTSRSQSAAAALMNHTPSHPPFFGVSFRQSMLQRWVFPLIACLVSAQISQAVVIEFTAGEGYSNGDLDGQPGFEVASGLAGFTVNTSSGGSVALDTAADSRAAIYQTAFDFTTGVEFTASIDFSFEQSGQAISNTTMLGLLYYTAPTGGTIGGTNAGFGRTTATDGYRLASFASSATSIAGSALGINSGLGDTTSDLLRLTLTLKRGTTSTTWIGTETLFNLTTATPVASKSSSTINVGGAHSDTSLYNGFAIDGSMSTSNLSSLSILNYSTPVPEPSTTLLLGLGVMGLAARRRRQL